MSLFFHYLYFMFKKYNTFSMFPYSYIYRDTSGSLRERDIEVETRVSPRNFEFSQTSTSVSITYG